MTRREAQRKIESTYKNIEIIYNLLKRRERELDDKRALILERILFIVSNDPQYKEGVEKLDDDGYRAYANMLTNFYYQMSWSGRRNSSLSNFHSNPSSNFIYIKPQPAFNVARIIHREPDPIRDIPESAWEKYVQRDIVNQKYFGPIPYKRTILLGTDFLLRILDTLPAPYDMQKKELDFSDIRHEYCNQDRDKSLEEYTTNASVIINRALVVSSFLSNALTKFNETASDGTHIGETSLSYEKERASSPVNIWTIKFTIRDILNTMRPFPCQLTKEEAKVFMNKLKLSSNREDRESYEKVLSLFD